MIENSYIFTLLIEHIILFIVKLYFIYFIIGNMIIIKSPNKSNMMFVFKPLEFMLLLFSLLTMGSEAYYLSYFFVDVKLYLYEYIAVFDEIFFTAIAIYYIKKGVSNGKS